VLAGKVALVTGGSRGLGAAIARELAAAGATGSIVDLKAGDAPAGWDSLVADVTVEETVATAFAATKERFGRLDVVVANAGVGAYARSDAAIPSSTFSYDYQVAQRAALRG